MFLAWFLLVASIKPPLHGAANGSSGCDPMRLPLPLIAMQINGSIAIIAQ